MKAGIGLEIRLVIWFVAPKTNVIIVIQNGIFDAFWVNKSKSRNQVDKNKLGDFHRLAASAL